jgi:SAM-dependent methyltransferase
MMSETNANLVVLAEEKPAVRPAAPERFSDRHEGERRGIEQMGFSDWNRRIAQRIEGWYLRGLNMESEYKQAIQELTETDSLILDAGAGKRCFYKRDGMHVVGADVLATDLAENSDISCAVATDLSAGFPFRAESFDAITACYFMEHIPDTNKFIQNAATVLKPNGRVFLLFPCRYAPFAIVNRMIPNRWTVGLLRGFLKDSHGGFPAKYSKCWPGGMRKVLERNGLRVIHQKVCHYQAFYCAAFLPLYLLCLAYDAMTRASGIETLASSVVMVAQKIDRSSDRAEVQPPLNS